MLLLGSGGAVGTTTKMTVGSYSYNAGFFTQDYYGYCNTTIPAPVGAQSFGSLSVGTFSGATILAIYGQTINAGNITGYVVALSGNRSAGFFNTLTVNGTLLPGTTGAPSYDSGLNVTTFAITPTTITACVWGTSGSATIILA